MTETTTVPTGQTVDPAENTAPSAVEPPSEEDGSADTASRDERRDARTRAKLKDVSAERDRLQQAITPYVRSMVETLAAERLADGSSLWILPGLDPLSLLDDDFAVDPEKVTEQIDRLLEHAPSLARRRFEGSGDGGARFGADQSGKGWTDLLKPR